MARTKNPIKPISPRTHGLIDYGFAAGNLLLPQILGFSKRARTLFAVFGLVQGGLNAVTSQPYAVSKSVPFRVHGAVEKSSVPVYALAPIVTGVTKDPRARAYWLLLGAVLVTVFNLTDWDAKKTSR